MTKDKEHYVFETADHSSYGLLKQFANENKLFATDAERALWEILKSKQLGYKFRRQHVIGNYIADFVSLHYKLIIEIDGEYHFRGDQIMDDNIREEELARMGYHIIRFTNNEVLRNNTVVAQRIKQTIRAIEETDRAKKSPLPTGRGGEGLSAWAVDAACSGNPGPMEYRGVDLATGAQVFHFGPIQGTNNIGEFLAIVHALALMDQQGIQDKAIYSDSYNAILWVSKKQCKTKLARTEQTEQVYQIIARAEQWLRTHPVRVPILKWETAQWGESPADFGRK